MMKFPKVTKASSCREILTFITYDSEALDALEGKLLEIKQELVSACPQDEGLLIEDPNHRKKFYGHRKSERIFSPIAHT